MPPAGAPERETEPRLLLALVAREGEAQEWDDMPEKFLRRGVAQNEVAYRRVAPGQVTELGDIEGVLHEAHVEHEVGGGRESVLVAETLHVHEHPGLSRSVQRVERVAQVLHRKVG